MKRMKRLFLGSMLVASLGMAPGPQPADATAGDCVKNEIYGCDDDFPPESEWLISIRGWCYVIRIGLCWLF